MAYVTAIGTTSISASSTSCSLIAANGNYFAIQNIGGYQLNVGVGASASQTKSLVLRPGQEFKIVTGPAADIYISGEKSHQATYCVIHG